MSRVRSRTYREAGGRFLAEIRCRCARGELRGGLLMHMHSLLRRKSVFIAAAISCTLITVTAEPARSNAADMNVMAVSGVVTGNVQEVGFRAMIQKQAIQYNLAGSAENDNDKSVRFILQGAKDQVRRSSKGHPQRNQKII
jgi:acylphosphatase